jgi:hypothetical protein
MGPVRLATYVSFRSAESSNLRHGEKVNERLA